MDWWWTPFSDPGRGRDQLSLYRQSVHGSCVMELTCTNDQHGRIGRSGLPALDQGRQST